MVLLYCCLLVCNIFSCGFVDGKPLQFVFLAHKKKSIYRYFIYVYMLQLVHLFFQTLLELKCSCTDWMLFHFSGSDGNKRNSPRKEFKGLWALQSKAKRRTLLYYFLWYTVCPQHLKLSRYFFLICFFFKPPDSTHQIHRWNSNAKTTVVLTSAVQECTRCLKSGDRPFSWPFMSMNCCVCNVLLSDSVLCECSFCFAQSLLAR